MRKVSWIWVVILLIIGGNISASAKQVNKQTFSPICHQLNLDSNQYAILYFHSIGSCEYCIEEILFQLICVSDKKINNLKIACLVYGNREIEIKSFRNNYSKIGLILLNSNHVEEKLGLKKNTKIVIVNSSGDVILELSQQEAVAFKLCNNIYNYLHQ